MRRFTTVSITMLAGIAVGGPACGSIIGIDTDKQLFPDGGAVSSSSGGEAGPAPTGSTAIDSGNDAPNDPANQCTPSKCRFGLLSGNCNPATNACERECFGGFCNTDCPPGLDCRINCHGDSCRNLRCRGGASCTIDCTDGNCEDVVCESPSCTFLCGQGNACDKAACGGANTTCQQRCTNPDGTSKECKSGILCCPQHSGDDDDDDLNPPPGVTRTCPTSSKCPD